MPTPLIPSFPVAATDRPAQTAAEGEGVSVWGMLIVALLELLLGRLASVLARFEAGTLNPSRPRAQTERQSARSLSAAPRRRGFGLLGWLARLDADSTETAISPLPIPDRFDPEASCAGEADISMPARTVAHVRSPVAIIGNSARRNRSERRHREPGGVAIHPAGDTRSCREPTRSRLVYQTKRVVFHSAYIPKIEANAAPVGCVRIVSFPHEFDE